MKNQKKVDIKSIIDSYIDNTITELKHRWNVWPKKLENKEVYDVIGGILSRQTSLTIEFSKCPNIWHGECAPIFLRCMADNHINLVWILNESEKRSKDFITYGLGQLKLELEHRKVQMEKDGINIEEDELIKHQEDFINSQRYTFLTDVNFSNWSGLSARKMAEEANCIDFYNYVYQPFSACVHSTWGHISKYNIKSSENPLHKFLLKPVIRKFEPDIFYMELASRYLKKSFDAFDEKFNLNPPDICAYNILMKSFEDL